MTWRASTTPIWRAESDSPSIGDGALSLRYSRDGDSLKVAFRLAAGSTTTFGSGYWLIDTGLQLAAAANPGGALAALAYDASEGEFHAGVAWLTDDSGFLAVVQEVPAYLFLHFVFGSERAGPTTPFTWAEGDWLLATGSVEPFNL